MIFICSILHAFALRNHRGHAFREDAIKEETLCPVNRVKEQFPGSYGRTRRESLFAGAIFCDFGELPAARKAGFHVAN